MKKNPFFDLKDENSSIVCNTKLKNWHKCLTVSVVVVVVKIEFCIKK